MNNMQITVRYQIGLLLLFFTWVQNLVFHIEWRTQVEGEREMVLSKIFVHEIEEVSESRGICVRNRFVTCPSKEIVIELIGGTIGTYSRNKCL